MSTLLNLIGRFGSIIETVEGFLAPYITQGIDMLEALPVWIQGVAILALALFAMVGLFTFLKKFIKLFIVLAILGGIGYYLYTQTDIIQNLLDGIAPAGFIHLGKGFPF